MELTAAGYLARHGAERLAALAQRRPDLFDRLLRRIEEHGFLAEQAERQGSFEPCSRDLELHLLPRLVERRDWPRVLRFALVALNLRELVEALRSPRLLRVLAAERPALAANLAGGAGDALDRAVSRAVVAAALRERGRDDRAFFALLLDALKEDLDTAAGAVGEASAERWSAALCAVARAVGPAVRGRWDGWLRVLEARPPLAGRVRLELAAAWLDEGRDEECWRLLGEVGDDGLRDGFVAARAARLVAGGLEVALERLARLRPAPGDLPWRGAVALLAAAVEHGVDAAAAPEAWRRLVAARGPVPWTSALAAAGAPLWRRLPPREVEALAARIAGAEVRAALRVGLAGGGGVALAAAEAAVDGLADDGAWIHWSLRLVAASGGAAAVGGTAGAAGRRRLRRVADLLAARRFDVPAELSALFLDLVAERFPGELAPWVEDVLWGPAADAATLGVLVERAGHPALLAELLRRAERHAAAVAGGEAEAFELRRRVLAAAAARLCRLRGDLSALEEAAVRLLPEEEDEVRTAVAGELAGAGLAELAARACDGIASPALRRRTRLGLLPGGVPAAALVPAGLYALVDDGWMDDELASLAVLLAVPVPAVRVARRHLAAVRDHGRRVRALVDLGHHALRFAAAFQRPHQRDPRGAVLPLRAALGVVESEPWLVSLLPELATLGARAEPKAALAELRQGVERVLAREAVPWERRQEALDRLLWESGGLLRAGGGRAARRRQAAWARWLLDLPRHLPAASPAGRELRHHGGGLLPCVVAAVERLPPEVLAGRRIRRLRVRGWLDGEATQAVAALCATSTEERARCLKQGRVTAPEAEALAWLLAAERPAAAEAAVAALDDAAARDRLRARVARFAPLSAAARRRWVERIADPGRRRLATLWACPAPGLEEVAAAAAAGDVDAADPRFDPVRRRTWRAGGGDEALARLAGAALAALRTAGTAAARSALVLWLGAAVAPVPGRPGRDADRERLATLRRAAAAARSISQRSP